MGIIQYLFIDGKECENAYLHLARKMLSATSCEYMDSERHAYLNTNGGHKLCKVNKPHASLGSKLFELFPRSGVTHLSTRKTMALPLLNSLHWIESHDQVNLMVKPSIQRLHSVLW